MVVSLSGTVVKLKARVIALTEEIVRLKNLKGRTILKSSALPFCCWSTRGSASRSDSGEVDRVVRVVHRSGPDSSEATFGLW